MAKLVFNDKTEKVEIRRNRNDKAPALSMDYEEFADFIQQVFKFMEQANPAAAKRHDAVMRKAHGKATRSEVWLWLRMEVANKIRRTFRGK